MNQKGQSAISDAMFFLLVITALSALLFFFSTGYGEAINQYLVSQYKEEVIVSAIKTLVFTTTARTDNPQEQDNLLVLLREDYYNYSVNNNPAIPYPKVSEATKNIFVERIKSVMAPLLGSYDYMFYIYIPPYYLTAEGQNDQASAADVVLMIISLTEKENNANIRNYYYCEPKPDNSGTGMGFVNSALLPNLGNTYKPNENSLNLFVKGSSALAYMNFIVWSPITYPIKNKQGAEVVNFTDPNTMNCQIMQN
ncbi:MAG: hypothetical protein AABW72_00030 [archaeon]